MPTSPADFNAQMIDEFHADEGRVGGMFEGSPLLLLHRTGAKCGKSRVNPLGYRCFGVKASTYTLTVEVPASDDEQE
jgi:hypothetical protein